MAMLPSSNPSATTSKPDTSAASAGGLSLGAYLRVFAIGTFFGLVMTKSEVVRWQRVHDMFLLREPHMYLIIATAIVVAGISMAILKSLRARSVNGVPIVYVPKPFQQGIIWGGILFGAGWALTGACPGPIYSQIGAGEPLAGVTLAGAVLGMFTYAGLKSRLPH